MDNPKVSKPVLDSSGESADLWLAPRNGRVVFDARGNSRWQWRASDDPFVQQDLQQMNAADLRIVEPGEIRRSQMPWVHERERPAKEFLSSPAAKQVAGQRTR